VGEKAASGPRLLRAPPITCGNFGSRLPVASSPQRRRNSPRLNVCRPPAWGAWIETGSSLRHGAALRRRPPRGGRWIETPAPTVAWLTLDVAPRVEGVGQSERSGGQLAFDSRRIDPSGAPDVVSAVGILFVFVIVCSNVAHLQLGRAGPGVQHSESPGCEPGTPGASAPHRGSSTKHAILLQFFRPHAYELAEYSPPSHVDLVPFAG
jgi:hypothetical protein